jgi:Family of unknown function (DUF5683)
MRFFSIIILSFFCFAALSLHAQDASLIKSKPASVKDTTILLKKDSTKTSPDKKDSVAKKRPANPKRATLYSLILPGLGQIYNKKYWKVPIVLAAVGIPAYTFIDNRKWYNRTRYALAVLANGSYFQKDSIAKVNPQLIPFIFLDSARTQINPYGISGLEKYRNYFRSNEDYSILFFLLFYGLNIVDATVDAHLKLFDVDRDLSIHIGIPSTPSSNMYAFSLFVDIHKAKTKLFDNTY